MESILHWIIDHGFDLVGSLGIVVSFGFSALSFRRDERARRIANLIELNSVRRSIWKEMYGRPELARVLKPSVELRRSPITKEEALFVTEIILHLYVTWRAMTDGEVRLQQAIEEDIRHFFTLPIPSAQWEEVKRLQENDFVRFVEASRK